MRKVNTNDVEEIAWASPKGKFQAFGREISEALGRDPKSTDLMQRHPFDVEVERIPPGATPCPYHSHSMQWEFFSVTSGTGKVRHADGVTAIGPGDSFLFRPGEPHQLFNDGAEDLVLFIVADNPIGESCYYPDSDKWAVHSPVNRLIRSEALDYFDREE